jgi:hypothetical protein
MSFLAFLNNKCNKKKLGENHYLKKNEEISEVGILLFFHFSLAW